VHVSSGRFTVEDYLKNVTKKHAMQLFLFFINDSNHDTSIHVRIRTHTQRVFEVILCTEVEGHKMIIGRQNFAHSAICSEKAFEDVLKHYCQLYVQNSFEESDSVMMMRPGEVNYNHPDAGSIFFERSLVDMQVSIAVVVMTIKRDVSQGTQQWRLDAIDDFYYVWCQWLDKLKTRDGNTSHGDEKRKRWQKEREELQNEQVHFAQHAQGAKEALEMMQVLDAKIDNRWGSPIHIPWRKYTEQFVTETPYKVDIHNYNAEECNGTFFVKFNALSSVRKQKEVPTSLAWLCEQGYEKTQSSFLHNSWSLTDMHKDNGNIFVTLRKQLDSSSTCRAGGSSSSHTPFRDHHRIPISMIPPCKIFMYFVQNHHKYVVLQRRKGASVEKVVVQQNTTLQEFEFENAIPQETNLSEFQRKTKQLHDVVPEFKHEDEPVQKAIEERNLDEVLRLFFKAMPSRTDIEEMLLIHVANSMLNIMFTEIYVPATLIADHALISRDPLKEGDRSGDLIASQILNPNTETITLD